MTTIASAQEALSHWQQALAVATGGKIFTTHGCSWAWQPVRKRLVLLFPEQAEPAGLRPALAEGMRLGAQRVEAWVNSGSDTKGLKEAGFTDSAQIAWHAGRLAIPMNRWEGKIRLGNNVPEATGPDAAELKVTNLWRETSTQLSSGHPALRRVEHAVARTEEGDIVGRGFVQQGLGGQLMVHSLAVGTGYRRQGVGTALLHGLSRSLINPLDPPDEEKTQELLAACTPGSAEFFSSNGLRLLGRGRHMILRSWN
ncbi:GNAT family N-acetyltransferase [Arthrobacter sp. MYb211]|uniref:GNAT family N-acetyltransferase n=1 Tax=unclassified Arthrobacter TaxID=235627 RepID=UPI000CFC7573|nr:MULTISPECIES: GNAT family N-acetyltransferase [unclassified Arthrobacter]PRA13784.1 GNAT family N-acetyltransferase [Arthrobacter sp. MYb221]PRC09154.1 GNAT family N-acetyltransferase [Arthrobacter sp. MYb211]